MLKLLTPLKSLSSKQTCISVFAAITWCICTWKVSANVYQLQVYMGLVLASIAVSYFLYKKFNWLVGIIYFYYCMNTMPRTVFPALAWPNAVQDPTVMVGFQSLNEEAFIYFTMILFSFYFLKEKFLPMVENFFLSLAIMDAVVLNSKFIYLTLTEHKINDLWYYFVMNNASIDATFLACVIPLWLARRDNSILWKLVLLALVLPCFFTFSASGIAGLGLAISMYYWSANKFSIKSTIIGAGISGAVASIGYVMQKEALTAGSGRTHIWKLALKYFFQNDSKLFGTGIGTYHMYGPALQMNEALDTGKDMIDGFFWAHNDWLQVMFESGFIGLFLALVFFIYIVVKARKIPKLFAGLVVFGTLAFVQMPLRQFVLTIIGAFLATWALYPPEKNSPQKAHSN